MEILTPFQKNALAYNKHISLTANAGSGKTTVLSKRYVEILENENISINNIVAITFTEKAASELYSKIARELESRIQTSTKSRKQKLENIRRSLVSAKISTIHSFCIDILKDYSPEAGIDANFSPIDARTSEELLEQSIDECITDSLNQNREDIKYLVRVLGNRSQLIKSIKNLFAKRKTVESLIESIYSRNTSEIQTWFDEKFESYLELLFSNITEDLKSSVSDLNAMVDDEKYGEIKDKINELLNNLNNTKNLKARIIILNRIGEYILTGKGTIRIQGYLSKKIREANIELVGKIEFLFKEISSLELEENDSLNSTLAEFGKWMMNLYSEVNEHFTVKKQQRSFLDFEDLLILTQKLTKNPEVREDLSSKYNYIMIDEYQDTNEIQYKIFMPILDNLNSGNLFIVGDEKQSIYRFREAEVELFNRTQNEISRNNNLSGVLDLPHSFRLAPNIALFTNVVFSRLFSPSELNFNEVEYNDLICAYNGDKKGEIEILISYGDEISESDLAAKKIMKLLTNHSGNYSFGDITVLCTRRKQFTELEESFAKFNIPFNIVGGKGFYQQQLVLDIYSYLSFLINVKNDLAIASILRGPFYGLSDEEITELVQSEGKGIFDKLSKVEKFTNIYSQLKDHIRLSKILNTNELIRKIANDTALWTYIASKPNGDQEIANLKKLIQKSIDQDAKGFSTLYDFTVFLKNAINNLEDEGQADIDIVSNAVNIMTVHQSKGLEFKVVFLFKTNQRSYDEKLRAKEIAVDKDFGLLSKLPEDNNFFEEYRQAPIIGLFNYLQKKKSLAERKRLLYVAVTRAEEKLIISSEIQKKVVEDSFAEMIFKSLKLDPAYLNIEISGDLEFMQFEQGNYSTRKEKVKTKISITKNIDLDDSQLTDEKIIYPDDHILLLDSKNYTEKNEIISASKISLFLNCPRKYELTYEFGYGELIKIFGRDNDLELNSKEDSEYISSNIIGRVLHAYLERNTSLNELSEKFDKIIRSEEIGYIIDSRERSIILKECTNILTAYYNSDEFKRLNKTGSQFNEIEFYKREKDYFLYGIVDKLILENNNAEIVDYKSDIINKENKNDKIETYLNQLMFYAYIISNKYPQIESYRLSIIFLRDVRHSFSKIVDIKQILEFGEIISSSVEKIRNKEFSDDQPGCRNMEYYSLPSK